MKRLNHKAGNIDHAYGRPLKRMRHKAIKGAGNSHARFKAKESIKQQAATKY